MKGLYVNCLRITNNNRTVRIKLKVYNGPETRRNFVSSPEERVFCWNISISHRDHFIFSLLYSLIPLHALFSSWSFFFFFTYFRLHEIFYTKLFIVKHIKSLPINVRWVAYVASVSVCFGANRDRGTGFSLLVLCSETVRKRLLRRLSGEHSLRQHFWLKIERPRTNALYAW